MNRLLTLLISLPLTSCFPAYQSGVPNVHVKVVDKNTGVPITNGKIKYASIPSYHIPGTEHPSNIELTSIGIEEETTQIDGWGAFGIFWPMQSPLPSTMKIEVLVPNYAPYYNTINTTTHGAFGPFNITETASLKPLQP